MDLLDQPRHSLYILSQPGRFYRFWKPLLSLIPGTGPQRAAPQYLFTESSASFMAHSLREKCVIAVPSSWTGHCFQKETAPLDCCHLFRDVCASGDSIAEGRAKATQHAGLQEEVLHWL